MAFPTLNTGLRNERYLSGLDKIGKWNFVGNEWWEISRVFGW
jgi:hypothetical protein